MKSLLYTIFGALILLIVALHGEEMQCAIRGLAFQDRVSDTQNRTYRSPGPNGVNLRQTRGGGVGNMEKIKPIIHILASALRRGRYSRNTKNCLIEI